MVQEMVSVLVGGNDESRDSLPRSGFAFARRSM